MDLAEIKYSWKKLVFATACLLFMFTAAKMFSRPILSMEELQKIDERMLSLLADASEAEGFFQNRTEWAPPLKDIAKLQQKKSAPADEQAQRIIWQAVGDVDIRVQAIGGDRNRRVALINDTMVSADDIIEGLTVISIKKEGILFKDKEGNLREVSVYGNLDQYDQINP